MNPETEIIKILDRVIEKGIFLPSQKKVILEIIKTQKNTLAPQLNNDQAVFLQALMLDYRMMQMPELVEEGAKDYGQYLRSDYDDEFSGMFDFSPVEQF